MHVSDKVLDNYVLIKLEAPASNDESKLGQICLFNSTFCNRAEQWWTMQYPDKASNFKVMQHTGLGSVDGSLILFQVWSHFMFQIYIAVVSDG